MSFIMYTSMYSIKIYGGILQIYIVSRNGSYTATIVAVTFPSTIIPSSPSPSIVSPSCVIIPVLNNLPIC